MVSLLQHQDAHMEGLHIIERGYLREGKENNKTSKS